MKRLFYGVLLFCVVVGTSGCGETIPTVDIRVDNAPEVWWGSRGESPTDSTDLWRQYDWVLVAK